MVSKQLIRVRSFGTKRFQKTVRLLIQNIPPALEKAGKAAADDIKDLAYKKVLPWHFNGELESGFKVYGGKWGGKGSYKYGVTNVAPHAIFLEAGVEEHVVALGGKYGVPPRTTPQSFENLKKYAEVNNIHSRFMTVGGPGSTIQKGRSKRNFLSSSFDKFVGQGGVNNIILKPMKKTIEGQWRKGAGGPISK